MMYSKQEKQALQLIAAAVLLGIFSLNPIARAEAVDDMAPVIIDVPARPQREPVTFTRQELGMGRAAEQQVAQEEKDGISLSDLNKILREPLQVRPNETKTSVAFLGDIPSRCVYNEKGEMTASIDYDKAASKTDMHVFRVHVPLCENVPNFKRVPGEKMTKVSSIPGARAINDVKGKVVLASGFKDSDSEPTIEELKNKGEAIVLESETIQRAAEAAAQRAALAEVEARQRKEEARVQQNENERILKKTETLCKEGDFDKLDKTFEQIPELREHVGTLAKSKILKDIDKADSADSAREAWEAFTAAAERLDWEDSEMKKGQEKYANKRKDLINAAIDSMKEGEIKLAEVERMVDDWAAEFRGIDSRAFAKHKDDFSMAYGNLAAAADNGPKKNSKMIAASVQSAERLYNKAKKYSNAADKTRVEGALAKINSNAFMACVKADPARMVECENKYRDKVKAHSENYASALAQKAQNGDEEAAAEVQAFAQDYLRADGFGQTASYQGFGTIHQMPGFFEQVKMQSLQEMRMRQQQMMMQQMYGGGMGMGAGMQQRSSFFGF